MISIALFIGLPDGEVFLYHLTRDLTKDPTIFLSPNHLCAVATLGKATGRRVSGNGVASYPKAFNTHQQQPLINTHHLSPIIHHPDGEVFGEMSGEMFSGHLTIQTPHEQRDSWIFGEVLSFLDYKSRNSQQPNSCSGKQPQVERQIRLNGAI